MYWSLVLSLAAAVPAKPKVHSFDVATQDFPGSLDARDVVENSFGSKFAQPCYLFELNIGTPQKLTKLWLDTGSANTWFSDKVYNYSDSSTAQKEDVAYSVGYVAGGVKGFWVKDKASLPTGWEFDYRFGQVDSGSGWGGLDGLLGLAPIPPEKDTENQSIINALYREQHIASRTFALWMGSLGHGNIVFGGYDSSRYTGDLTVVPFWPDVGGFGIPVSQFHGFDAKGNRILLAEGGIKCAIDTGVGPATIPKAAHDALIRAFNITEAKNVPAALEKGFKETALVYQYQGHSGYSLNVAGLELDIPMEHWLSDAHGNFLNGVATVGEWYGVDLKGDSYCLIGNRHMYHNYYVVANYDHHEFAIAPVVQERDYSATPELHTVGTEGFAGLKSAPNFDQTTAKAYTGYTTYFPGDSRATASASA